MLLIEASEITDDDEASETIGMPIEQPFEETAAPRELSGHEDRPDQPTPDDETEPWLRVGGQADRLQAELMSLEQSVAELADVFGESSDVTPEARAYLGEILEQLDELRKRRRLLDAIGSPATHEQADRITERNVGAQYE